MEQTLVVPFLYREFCAKTLEQGDLRSETIAGSLIGP